jgi:tRNA/tmRNA/rRNA uracil-C5-methylase (TrmA/RlmC/RlmD family)
MLIEFTWQPSDVLEVVSLSTDGRGLCRHCGWVVLVHGALPGEQITLQSVSKKGSFWEGVLAKIQVPSLNRTSPPCPHFGVCGGCQLQHLDEDFEAQTKVTFLKHNLKRVGNWSESDLANINISLHKAEPWAYRQRARLHKSKGANVGFRQSHSHEVVDVKTCPILSKPLNETLAEKFAQKFFEETEISADRSGHVYWHEVQSRRGLLERKQCAPATTAMIEIAHPRITNFVTPLAGFVQPHKDAIGLYHACIEKFLLSWFKSKNEVFKLNGKIETWDLFSGSGALSFAPVFAALDAFRSDLTHPTTDVDQGARNERERRVHETYTSERSDEATKDIVSGRVSSLVVRAVEGISSCIEAAELNFKSLREALEGKIDVQFKAKAIAVHAFLAGFSGNAPAVCLLDPPRTGFDPGTQKALMKLYAKSKGPKAVCYVACDSSSLARDARHLVDHCGFVLTEAHVFNTFAQTIHFETIAFFVKE